MTVKENIIFIEYILECITNIESFTKNVSKEDFMENLEKQSAVVRQLEIIGEAVKNLPDSFRSKHPNVPWREIAGTRDKIIHHYFGVDLEIVWQIVKSDLSDLKKKIKKIKNEIGD
jgi:uncharacterized protein with HEPN domain